MTEDEHNDAMDEGLRSLGAQTDRLVAAVTAMSERLNTTEEMQRDLAATMRQQKTQGQRQTALRRVISVVAVSLALDLALTLGLAYVGWRVDHNSDRISGIQERTSSRVLCPLYEILVAQVDSAPSDAADDDGDGKVTPEEQAEFDRTVKVIRDGHKALECRRKS